MFYAALDASLRSVAICIDAGKVRLERSTSSELPDLIRCLQNFGGPIHQVGLEVAATLRSDRYPPDRTLPRPSLRPARPGHARRQGPRLGLPACLRR
jgi:hypothetical protein